MLLPARSCILPTFPDLSALPPVRSREIRHLASGSSITSSAGYLSARMRRLCGVFAFTPANAPCVRHRSRIAAVTRIISALVNDLAAQLIVQRNSEG
jgi:hypothetical protein